MRSTWTNLAGTTILSAVVITVAGQTPRNATVGAGADWPTYGGDLASTRYSPLDQITAQNFSQLEVAWRFKTDNLGPRPEFNLQSTPLVIGGTLYSTGGTRRAVFALDAATGELRWVYSLDEGKRGSSSPRPLSGRGLAHWSDGTAHRILFITPGYRLVALDATTGRPVPGFGTGGIVDLKADDDQKMDLEAADIGYQSAPIVANGVIVVGAAHSAGQRPPSRINVKGSVRGYDARTGKKLWTFHTVPRPGETGSETWLRDSAAYTGNTGAWAQMSADEQLGLVYVPTEMPTNDAYGGHRPGDNLFADSIVALDIRTGRRAWHYQTVHHNLWDFDLPCAPILMDLIVDGTPIKALAQPTKQAFLFVLDRTNGKPVWPIPERPVPAGDVPGEAYSPTQPIPSKPPAYDRQGTTPDDLIDFTPELRAEAAALVSTFRMGPIYTPPTVSAWNGPRGTLMLPHTLGGTNWPGGSFDAETSTLYVYSGTDLFSVGLVRDPKRSDMDFIQGVAPKADPSATDTLTLNMAFQVRGIPAVKPPWGRMTAIDMRSGTLKWQVAHGDTPDEIRNHPALKGVTIPRTGRQGRIGTLVTKTLLIAGEGGSFTTPTGRKGAMLRAYDKGTGRDAGEVYMPAPQTGSPMTYAVNGRQYLVVAISGPGYSGELVAFRAPQAASRLAQ